VDIIAHRGASYDAPENTIASVQLAWEQGADAVEIDVQCSRDGHLVVIHNDNTAKTAGLRKRVNALTVAELAALDAGSWKDARWAGERIPTLEQVLALVPDGKRIFIEIKCEPTCLAEFAKIIRRSRTTPEQIVVISFALETMKLVKHAVRQLEVCWIAEFQRNWKTGGWSPKPQTLIEKTRKAGLDGLDFGANGPINADLVKQVKAAGLHLYVWTVDSPAQACKLLRAGVDGITTNRPGWLRQQLRSLSE
jgi:glycerophosphoryl diester phosphodiesterase